MRSWRPIGWLGWLALSTSIAAFVIAITVEGKSTRVTCQLVATSVMLAWAFTLLRRERDATQRNYLSFDPRNGYPASETLLYECVRCGDVIPSKPSTSRACTCENLRIDADYGRLSVDDDALLRVFSRSG